MAKEYVEDEVIQKEKRGSTQSQYIGEKSGCGLGGCTPTWLQCCADIRAFTALAAIASMVSQVLVFYMVSQITTVERQFGLSSTQSGFLLSANDIGFLVAVLFASHLGRSAHRPRILSIVTILFGIFAVIGAVPHFIMLSYDMKLFFTTVVTNRHTCNIITDNSTSYFGERTADDIKIISHVRTVSFALLTMTFICQGVLKAPRFPITITFIDEHVIESKTGLYMAVLATIGVIGLVIAFGVGAVFTNIYVTMQPTSLTPRDPRWVGAWWLGFVIVGAVAIVAGLPLICFPRKLRRPVDSVSHAGSIPASNSRAPSIVGHGVQGDSLTELNNKDHLQDRNDMGTVAKIQDDRDVSSNDQTKVDTFTETVCDSGIEGGGAHLSPQKHGSTGSVHNGAESFPRKSLSMHRKSVISVLSEMKEASKHFDKEIRDFPKALCRLLRNPVYLFLLIGDGFQAIVAIGRVSYLPKYIESHFQIVASRANMLFGITMIVGASLGALTGGISVSCFKVSPRGCLMWMVIAGTIGHVFLMASGAIKCPQANFHGYNMKELLAGTKSKSSKLISCGNQGNCSCSDDQFLPVCGSDGKNYFSPCHAGCSREYKSVFSDCSCIDANLTSTFNVYKMRTNTTLSQVAIPGYCPSKCTGLFAYLAMGFVGAFAALTQAVPKIIVNIRIVKDKDRSLAIGMNSFVVTLFGSFLSPILFGAIIDTSCILWRGSCRLYNIADLRTKYHVHTGWLGLLAQALYAVALIVVMCCKKYANILDRKDISEGEIAAIGCRCNLRNKARKGKTTDGTNQQGPAVQDGGHTGAFDNAVFQGETECHENETIDTPL